MDEVKLWPHQEAAMEYALKRQTCGLFMDMGTGKTRVVLELIRNSQHRFVLVVMPKNVLVGRVWQDEIEKTYGDKDPIPPYIVVSLEHGTSKEKAEKLANPVRMVKNQTEYYGLVFVLVNYDSVWRKPLADALLKAPFDLIVLDEGHRIKAAGSKVSKYFAMLTRHNPKARRIALTGTPLPNSPLDAYGLCRFIDPNVFGTRFAEFQARYAVMGGFNNYQVLRYINLDELNKKLASISFRVTNEVLKLPPVMHITRSTVLEGTALDLYRSLHDEMVAELNSDTITADNVLVKITRMQQITGGFAKFDYGGEETVGDSKQKLLEDVLSDLPTRMGRDGSITKEPVVVFARFIHDLDVIRETAHSCGYRVSEISGRRKELQEWQSGKTDMLIVQIQSGSEGINLTRAHYGIYYSTVYSLGVYQQSLARLSRPGQTETTFFIHLVCRGTIDEAIYTALNTKKNIVDLLLTWYSRHTAAEQ